VFGHSSDALSPERDNPATTYWVSLQRKRAKRAVMRVAKSATDRAARPDPSLRKRGLLGMTIQTDPLTPDRNAGAF
jgi:hypothetical protein